MHKRIAAVVDERVAHAGIAGCVLGADLPDSVPRTQVRPAGGQRHHAQVEPAFALRGRRGLHHRIVHRLGGNGRERFRARANEAGVDGLAGPGQARGGGDVGAETFDGGEPDGSPHDEHAAVPVVVALVEIALRGREIGLFDEAFDHQHVIDRAGGGADVAEAGLGPVRRHAEDHDRAAGCDAHRALQCQREGRVVGDGLVGGADHEHRVGARFERVQSGQRHRRGGVAAHRFEQGGGRWQLQFTQLVEHQEAVFLVADDAGRGDSNVVGRQRRQPLCGLLEQAAVAAQHEELLRMLGAREWPQAGAAAAGHDDRLNQDFVHGMSNGMRVGSCQPAKPFGF